MIDSYDKFLISSRNKNVLLIMPKYFGYEIEIERELRKVFHDVFVVYENITELNIFYDIVYHHFNEFSPNVFLHYYKRELKNVSNNIDYVFAIRGFSLSKEIINLMKSKFKKETKYILWQWDSIKNNRNVLNIVSLFDKVLTFDIEDAKEFGFEYRPNFYLNINKKEFVDRDIDLLYIGSFSFDRYSKLQQLKKIAKEKKLNLYTVLYISRFTFYFQKYMLKDKLYSSVERDDLSFKSLNIREVYDLYAKSKIVVEITSKNQTGYTMRSIDCLINECKLITNNKYLKSADFYKYNNINIIEDEKLSITDNFIRNKYENIERKIIDYYSINSWLFDILKNSN